MIENDFPDDIFNVLIIIWLHTHLLFKAVAESKPGINLTLVFAKYLHCHSYHNPQKPVMARELAYPAESHYI